MEYLGNLETPPQVGPKACWINLCGVNGNCIVNL